MNRIDGRTAAKEAPGPTFRWGARFSPHVLVFLATLLAAIPPLRGAIVSGINWWWDESYTKVDFVMDEARPNDGVPYIAGHLEGSTEQRNLAGEMRGTTMVVEGVPEVTVEPGKRIQIWHSPDAPNMLVFGRDTNDVPVASLPERPGWPSMLLYLAWLYVTFVVGLRAMAWVAQRWSRTMGDLPMDRQSRRRFRV